MTYLERGDWSDESAALPTVDLDTIIDAYEHSYGRKFQSDDPRFGAFLLQQAVQVKGPEADTIQHIAVLTNSHLTAGS